MRLRRNERNNVTVLYCSVLDFIAFKQITLTWTRRLFFLEKKFSSANEEWLTRWLHNALFNKTWQSSVLVIKPVLLRLIQFKIDNCTKPNFICVRTSFLQAPKLMFITILINVRDGTFIITKMHFSWNFSTERNDYFCPDSLQH